MKQVYFIIDFDSTFIKSEALEKLSEVSLKNNPSKEKILNKIKELTALGMEGRIPFSKSLSERIKLIQSNRKDIQETVNLLKKEVSTSIKRNKSFFKKYSKNIYIISGGFVEFIEPIVSSYGILGNHILANSFLINEEGVIVGIDKNNLLSKPQGKVLAVKSLNLKGDIYVIGDGYTDYQIKKMAAAKHFVAFTENVKRETVVSQADSVAESFDDFLFINNLPRVYSYPKNRIKTLLLENISHEAKSLFTNEGYKVQSFPSIEGLDSQIGDFHILGIRSQTQISKQVIEKGRMLKAIGAYCIGTDQIDLKSATARGIAVFNAPYSNTRSVVELTIGNIIALSRGVFDKSNALHKGIWDKSSKGSFELRGKTIGIVGYGNIGSQLSVLAENLGMNVVFYDIEDKLPLGNAKKKRSLKELLREADILTIHVDGRAENKNLISTYEFNLMKDKVLFLNLSRGKVVDIESLVKSLKSGKVAGAAIDVFPFEPKGKDDRFLSSLQNLPNTILTPHIGGSTVEAQKNIAEYVSNKIIDYINTGSTTMSVNIPNINVSKQKNSHRLLHFHKNVPNMLAQINSVLGESNINIVGQYLKTNEQIGYLITDVNKKYDQSVLIRLKNIPNTIRFRVLY